MTILGIFTALTYTQMIAVLVVLLLGVAVGGFYLFRKILKKRARAEV